jgi:hypothetical protein
LLTETCSKTKHITDMKTILRKDFDNAVKQPWGTNKCILAQAAKRQRMQFSGLSPNEAFNCHAEVRRVRRIFDKFFNLPGDEEHEQLKALRASLPIKIK